MNRELKKIKYEAEEVVEDLLVEWESRGLYIHQIRLLKHEDGDTSVTLILDSEQY